MRGRFTPDAPADEWCERRLLARIHRYTVKRLRAEIEPVAARDFLRFLFALAARRARRAHGRARRRSTPSSASSKASRRRPAPGRARSCRRGSPDYEPAWLDERCLAGHVAWTRLRPRSGRPTATQRRRRCARRRSRCCRAAMPRCGRRCRGTADAGSRPSPRAQAVADCIRAARRLVLRRAGARHRPAALPGRGGAGRAGGARPRHLRQLRRLARAAGAVRRAQAGAADAAAAAPSRSAWRMPAAGRWCAVPAARRPHGRGRRRRACRAHAAAPLRRGVLAPARARGRLAAAVARAAARLSPARRPRRDPRRPLRRRLLRRAVRPARRDRHAARGAAPGRRPTSWIVGVGRRSAQPRRHPDAGAAARGAHRQPVALSRRRADRDCCGRRGQFLEPLDAAAEWDARKALLRGTGHGASLAAEWAATPDVAPAGS